MQGFEIGRIHPTAIISSKSWIGKGVTIGANCIVYDNVEIGANTFIGPNSSIGEPLSDYYEGSGYVNPELSIGPNSLVRSSAIIYAGSVIGPEFECGHRVTIRENTHVGQGTRIGTMSDIQGFCEIGDHVRFHSSVHIAQESKIGNFIWIYPYVVLANDPHPPSNVCNGVTIDDFAVIAVGAVVFGGVRIGHDSLIGARSVVRSNVPAEAVVVGAPARQVGTIHDIVSQHTGQKPYPWREHFDRGMPWEGIGYQQWLESIENNRLSQRARPEEQRDEKM
jgi:acetyltransferase-like isoleucine patch superfamily enzyme